MAHRFLAPKFFQGAEKHVRTAGVPRGSILFPNTAGVPRGLYFFLDNWCAQRVKIFRSLAYWKHSAFSGHNVPSKLSKKLLKAVNLHSNLEIFCIFSSTAVQTAVGLVKNFESFFDNIFWKVVANPQSGEMEDVFYPKLL